MTLIEEVRASFERYVREEDNPAPVKMVREADVKLAPGFNASRASYDQQMMVYTRRGYRQFAGATMPAEPQEIIERTGEVMVDSVVALTMYAFANGVKIGHRDEHLVKMCFHFDQVDRLFQDEDFIRLSQTMAAGFAGDPEVRRYFQGYVTEGLKHLAHMTGWLHQKEPDPNKVWDIWLLHGSACTNAGYLAGYQLGTAWRERDVLDGIEIATEEVPNGTEGPDGDGR